MTGTSRGWVRPLLAVALLMGACGVGCVQVGLGQRTPGPSQPDSSAGAGSLAGRLTDLHAAPLAWVTVVLRNQATGAELRTTTGKNGAYRFTGLEAGAYSLEAESEQLGRSRLEGIEVFAGHEARVQAAMGFEPAAPAPVLAVAKPAPAASGQMQVAISVAAPVAIAAPVPARALLQLPLASRSVPEPVRPRTLAGKNPLAPPPTLSGPAATIPSAPQQTAAALATVGKSATPLLAAVSAVRELSPGAAVQPNLAVSAMVARGFDAAIAFGAVESNRARSAAFVPDPAAAAVTTTITAGQLAALPASGRHWQEFMLDTPSGEAAPGSSQTALRGAGQDPADTTIDGASTRLAFGSAAGAEPATVDSRGPGEGSTLQTGMSQGYPSGRGLAISEVAIREVSIVAGNVEAEGAHAAGGRTSVETESGANQFHGQGFIFDRQNTWGARNPFTQWVQNTGTVAAPIFSSEPYTPSDHETTWGIGAGSRIKRDKLFWFGALDSYRRNDPGVASAKTASEFFTLPEPTSPAVVLLSAQLGESENQAYNDYLGVPSAGYGGAGLEQLAGLLGPAPRASAQWVGFARIDWQATERHRFTMEGIGAESNSPGGGLTRVSEDFGNHSFGSSQASEAWLLARWEAFITPNLVAVTQASAGRNILAARPDPPSPFETAFLSGNAYGQLPQVVVDSRYGFTIGNPSRFGQGSYPDERLYHGQEMVDWVRNKLLVKAGFEIDHNSDATSLLRNQTGSYYYAKVQDFISDAMAFEKFGLDPSGARGNTVDWHNCGVTAAGLGALPCYSYFSQVIGPTFWHLSTNDWAGYVTAQWQANKMAVFSAGLRWEREQLPPPLAMLNNPELPLTEKLPDMGNQWGPRVSLAVGKRNGHWPLLRLGYGMYFGRTENATIQTALTQTGSLKGDLNYFIRPTDGLNPSTETSAAPLFPYVLQGQPASVVTPGALEFAPNFRNPEVHQAVASVEEALPGRILVTTAAMVSLGRRLPVSIDTNFDPAVNPKTITFGVVDKTGLGPIKTSQVTVPFYALWPAADCPVGSLLTLGGACGRLHPDYQQITEIMSRANSTYEAATIKIVRYGERGLSLHAHYTYAHAMDWNPNESTTVAGSDVLDPADFSQEYGTSNLDVRHSAAVMAIYEPPWKFQKLAGRIANGWMLSGIGQFHSGLPYTMRVSGSLPEEHNVAGNLIVGLGPGMNGSGGDNRIYGIGRNTFRYPETWKADLRLGKKFNLGEMRQLEIMAESFNLFNHQNVTELETTGYSIESGGASGTFPTLCYLTINPTASGATCATTTTPGSPAPAAAFGTPLSINGTNFYRERQIQFGVRLRF